MYCYGVGVVEGSTLPGAHSEIMEKLKGWGLRVCPELRVVKGVQGCHHYYQEIEDKRDSLPYDIDGVVYKVNSLAQQPGVGIRLPRTALATAHKSRPRKR